MKKNKKKRTEKRQVNSFNAGRFILLLIVIAAVIINIAQFSEIEHQNLGAGGRYRALNKEVTSSITDIGMKYSPNFRETYGLALSLAETYPGAKLYISTKGSYSGDEFITKMLGYGRVASIEKLSYDENTFLLEFDPTDYVKKSGEGGSRGDPFAIAVSEYPSGEFIVLRRDGPLDLLVDTSLLPDNALKEVNL